jgi:hypothetical protein
MILEDLWPRKGTEDWFGMWIEFKGKRSIEILQILVDECAKRNILVVLDLHCLMRYGENDPLWYNEKYGEDKVIECWDKVLSVMKGKWNIFGLDITNEPFLTATWYVDCSSTKLTSDGHRGNFSPSTDWNKAAERICKHIIAKHPEFRGLFLVQEVLQMTAQKLLDFPIDLGSPEANQRVLFTVHAFGPDVEHKPEFDDERCSITSCVKRCDVLI